MNHSTLSTETEQKFSNKFRKVRKRAFLLCSAEEQLFRLYIELKYSKNMIIHIKQFVLQQSTVHYNYRSSAEHKE